MNAQRSPRYSHARKIPFALASILPLIIGGNARAVEFSFLQNELTGSLDTTLSYGRMWRVQGQDKASAAEISTNDGNRNFDPGLVSEVFKATSELEAKYQNYGLFVRGSAFYDTQLMDKRTDYNDNNDPRQPSSNTPNDSSFSRVTRHLAGRDAQILDSYVYGNWDINGTPLGMRLGKQVFNWGEGLFFRNGVNASNPVDVSRFRLPGAEVKEILIPVEAFSFNLGLTDNLSLESYYQLNWKETALEPVGTYFGSTDLFAKGATEVFIQQPQLSQVSGAYQLLQQNPVFGLQGNSYFLPDGTFKASHIGSDLNARDSGQYGVALRYNMEEIDTEFGLYAMNYHSKEPQIYSETAAGYTGVNLAAIGGALAGSGVPPLQIPQAVAGIAAVDLSGQLTTRREYVEDIRMYGLSFNTSLGDASVFGEISYRPNLPIAIATATDLLGDLLPQAYLLSQGQSIQVGGNKTLSLSNSTMHNYERVESFNSSLGVLYNFGPSLGFDSLMGVAEVACEALRGSSLHYKAYDGSTRYYSGAGNTGGGRDYQINRNSYGYALAVSGTWNDVFAGVNLSPFLNYKSDVEGNSHQTGGFVEGRQAYTAGMRANYQNQVEAEIQYTEFWGGGHANGTRDRDNVGVNLKYFF